MNNFAPSDSTKAKQQTAILKALESGPLTTLSARENLSICHPAGRVAELRRRGFKIETHKIRTLDAEGRPHVVAMYMLQGGDE